MSLKRKRIALGVAIGCLAVCGAMMCACSSTFTSTANTGKVAATVNGVEISEDKVTQYIEDYRTDYEYTDNDSWAEWMNTYGYTAADLRSDVLDMYIEEELVKQAAAEKGLSVSSEEVDETINEVKEQFSTEEGWIEALEENGYTEEEYREAVEYDLLYDKLQSAVVTSDEAPEDTVLSYCSLYAQYYDGMKRSSHILFDAEDEATAQQVLDQINAGTLDFATAAAQYSIDSTASSGGDVGWDQMTSFVDEYQDALDELSVGEVSGLVTSTYGIHIIKCTDEFEAPDTVTSTSQLPDELVETIRSYADSSYASSAFDDWLEEYKEGCEIVINDMPEGMSYDVDMSKYETEDEESDDADEESDESEDIEYEVVETEESE